MTESFRSPRKIVRRLRYLPLAIQKIRNWPSFMYHYALGLTPSAAYRFRNGARLIIGRGIDHVPIIEIFLEEEYGSVPQGAVVIDLGANIGVFTIYAAATAREARVYAYEPMPEFFAVLNKNIRLNRNSESVQAFNCAVASEVGARHLDVEDAGFFFPRLVDSANNKNSRALAVRCTTLAQILKLNHLDHVDFLKMDCEGAEYEILYSSALSDLKKIKEIRMEYHNLDSDTRHADGLKRFFAQNGFSVTHQHATSETNGTLWVKRD